MERLRAVHRVLAGHRVDDQQDLVRREQSVDGFEFLHQLVVDVESAGRIENDGVEFLRPASLDATPADADGGADRLAVFRASFGFSVECDLAASRRVGFHAFGGDSKLLDRGGPLQIRSDHQNSLSSLLQQGGELAATGRFSTPLESAHHEDGRTGIDQHQMGIHRSHQFDESSIDDLDHLLPRLQALDDLLADGIFDDLRTEFLDDVEMDVGFEQGGADLLHGLTNV